LSFFEAEFNNFAVRCPIGELDTSKVAYESWLSEEYHHLGRKPESLDHLGDAPLRVGEGEGSIKCRKVPAASMLSSHEANLNAYNISLTNSGSCTFNTNWTCLPSEDYYYFSFWPAFIVSPIVSTAVPAGEGASGPRGARGGSGGRGRGRRRCGGIRP
jgi:hypothetical protein